MPVRRWLGLTATPYRRDGLQVVRYSPKERAIPGYLRPRAVEASTS